MAVSMSEDDASPVTDAIQAALTIISAMMRPAREAFDFRPNLSVLVAIDNANMEMNDGDW